MDNLNKKIFLVETKKYFLKNINNDSVKLIYSDSSRLKKTIRKIIFKFNLPFYSFFFSDWKYELKKYNTVIILDTSFRRQIVKYIKKVNPNCRVIFYYWNLINREDEYRVINYQYLKEKNIDEFWTFNLNDAKKYDLKYNSQFYTNDIKLNFMDKFDNDIIFVGRNKNRKSLIVDLKSKLENQNIKCDFRIIENVKELITYDKYLEMLSKSKVILDIINENETGLTLRCLEALFFEKKLITNNKDIKNYDFYKKNNVFILGEDDFENIKSFINGEYENINSDIVSFYDYNNWLERF